MSAAGDFGRSSVGEASGAGSANSSPGTSEKKKPLRRLTDPIPCTVALIHEMPDSAESLEVGTSRGRLVTFVGLVKSMQLLTARMTYEVGDFTGPGIQVHMMFGELWIGERDNSLDLHENVRLGSYARVTGVPILVEGGRRVVIASDMRPVAGTNEINAHTAEVMAVAATDKQSGAASRLDPFVASYLGKIPNPHKLVLRPVLDCREEQGISVWELCDIVKCLSHQSIQEALEYLCNEGEIYQTIDEDHYKSTGLESFPFA